jgi:hypothetical protein
VDGKNFDSLVKQIAASQSTRRSTVKQALGLVGGGALALITGRSALAAKKRSLGQSCMEDGDCLSDDCLPKDSRGRRLCGCGDGFSLCSGVCQRTDLDPRNCGACGNQCDKQTGGNCCDGQCTDIVTDPQNCGACGVVADTARNEACCSGSVTQLGTEENCASCGDACAYGLSCVLGGGGYSCELDPGCDYYTITGTGTFTGTVTVTCLT